MVGFWFRLNCCCFLLIDKCKKFGMKVGFFEICLLIGLEVEVVEVFVEFGNVVVVVYELLVVVGLGWM